MTSPWWLYSGIVPIVSSHARSSRSGRSATDTVSIAQNDDETFASDEMYATNAPPAQASLTLEEAPLAGLADAGATEPADAVKRSQSFRAWRRFLEASA